MINGRLSSDDFVSLSRPGGQLASEFGDEANIAYVAFTRAIRELYLTLEWQTDIRRYEPI